MSELVITNRIAVNESTGNLDQADRVLRFINAVNNLQAEDVEHLDQIILDREKQLSALRNARQLAASVVTPGGNGHTPRVEISVVEAPVEAPEEEPAEEPKPGPKDKFIPEHQQLLHEAATCKKTRLPKVGKAARKRVESPALTTRLLPMRQQVVRYLAANGAKRSQDIITACSISSRWINFVLDHKWFSQSSQGVHITPTARQDVLDS